MTQFDIVYLGSMNPDAVPTAFRSWRDENPNSVVFLVSIIPATTSAEVRVWIQFSTETPDPEPEI